MLIRITHGNSSFLIYISNAVLLNVFLNIWTFSIIYNFIETQIALLSYNWFIIEISVAPCWWSLSIFFFVFFICVFFFYFFLFDKEWPPLFTGCSQKQNIMLSKRYTWDFAVESLDKLELRPPSYIQTIQPQMCLFYVLICPSFQDNNGFEIS